MAEIVMPRLSDTMEEGTILQWLKADGQQVARGEALVEIETDKASMTYESDQDGVLEIVAAEGDTLPVGAVIARVGDGAAGEPAGAGAADGSGAGGPSAGHDGERVKASPLARRLAGDSGVDLHSVSGSGPGGRIVKADVLGAASHATGAGTAPASDDGATGAGETRGAPTIEGVLTAKGETTEVELSRTQQTVARRMAESKATIPDFTLLLDVDMEECVALRAQLKRLSQPGQAGETGDGAETAARDALKAPTYNDMVVKACALALREHPHANGSYRDGKALLHSRVNVGVAVAAQNALVVPTVFDADEKSVGEIARETHTLVERVRSGAITPPELGGGTFTVSNLGMYGVRSFTAIINPPQAGILSVGAMAPRAVVRDGAVVARNTMTLTLACDHRILYGTEAAQFLARVRELLEAPAALTL
ncbi:MAG TPA: dihydrolipoamide acetyltransferase family protein [Solirubrobacteraceae bacterium]|jgi:pyruvate dehydrogenase E2 component (dihydrolipoamide acetyltransferase)|nr:dihydrolipoamide acetyltransferase family protein [Solirubrobacteraceae bacterium]